MARPATHPIGRLLATGKAKDHARARAILRRELKRAGTIRGAAAELGVTERQAARWYAAVGISVGRKPTPEIARLGGLARARGPRDRAGRLASPAKISRRV